MKKSIGLVIITVFLIFMCACQSPAKRYEAGVEAMKNQEWEIAIEYFTDLDYEDSKQLLQECQKEKGMHEASDYDFLETMAKSIMKRREKAENGASLKECVNYELEMLGKFRDEKFYDKTVKELALSYLSGLDMEKDSLSLQEGSQQLKKEEGTLKRFKTLKELTDKYGFLKDNIEYRTTYYNEVENKEFEYTALQEVEKCIDKQLPDGMLVDIIDSNTARRMIKNTTKYDFDMSIHFVFYDKNGTIIKNSNEYFENIKSGKKYNLDFYFPENADSFDWYTEEYNLKKGE